MHFLTNGNLSPRDARNTHRLARTCTSGPLPRCSQPSMVTAAVAMEINQTPVRSERMGILVIIVSRNNFEWEDRALILRKPDWRDWKNLNS